MHRIRTELGRGAYLDMYLEWLDEPDTWLDRLIREQCWQARAIQVFGRDVMQPRLIDWAGGLPYRYSGQTLEPRPWTRSLNELLHRVVLRTGVLYNHALLNRYRDGQDHMGMHADDEPELGRCPSIAAVSLGARRRFVLAPKRGRDRRTVWLEPGSLLVMGGSTQHGWRHGVPRQSTVTTERINVTFRFLTCNPRSRRRAGAPRRGVRGAQG
ncbi:MAG: alpha-ketoglutarate-dependent dioxygenase AlkB [Myxococcota bacterium]